MFWPFFFKVFLILLLEVMIGQVLYTILLKGKESNI